MASGPSYRGCFYYTGISDTAARVDEVLVIALTLASLTLFGCCVGQVYLTVLSCGKTATKTKFRESISKLDLKVPMKEIAPAQGDKLKEESSLIGGAGTVVILFAVVVTIVFKMAPLAAQNTSVCTQTPLPSWQRPCGGIVESGLYPMCGTDTALVLSSIFTRRVVQMWDYGGVCQQRCGTTYKSSIPVAHYNGNNPEAYKFDFAEGAAACAVEQDCMLDCVAEPGRRVPTTTEESDSWGVVYPCVVPIGNIDTINKTSTGALIVAEEKVSAAIGFYYHQALLTHYHVPTIDLLVSEFFDAYNGRAGGNDTSVAVDAVYSAPWASRAVWEGHIAQITAVYSSGNAYLKGGRYINLAVQPVFVVSGRVFGSVGPSMRCPAAPDKFLAAQEVNMTTHINGSYYTNGVVDIVSVSIADANNAALVDVDCPGTVTTALKALSGAGGLIALHPIVRLVLTKLRSTYYGGAKGNIVSACSAAFVLAVFAALAWIFSVVLQIGAVSLLQYKLSGMKQSTWSAGYTAAGVLVIICNSFGLITFGVMRCHMGCTRGCRKDAQPVGSDDDNGSVMTDNPAVAEDWEAQGGGAGAGAGGRRRRGGKRRAAPQNMSCCGRTCEGIRRGENCLRLSLGLAPRRGGCCAKKTYASRRTRQRGAPVQQAGAGAGEGQAAVALTPM